LSLQGRLVSHSHSQRMKSSWSPWIWQQKTDVALRPWLSSRSPRRSLG
jgi:hypothetical protein